MLELTYIYHDCFKVRTPQCVLLFDYWQMPDIHHGSDALYGGDASQRRKYLPNTPFTKEEAELPIYIFVSHFHKDHYNKEIFDWSAFLPNVHYIISKDTARHARHILRPDSLYNGIKPAPQSVTILREGERYKDPNIIADAFGSTDIGNSYVVTLTNYGDPSQRRQYTTILHAGDLNAWIWKDESTQAEVDAAIRDYLQKLAPIAEYYPQLDIAMFPVDSRIGTDYWTGARLLLERIEVARFFPMHFCNEPHLIPLRAADALRFSLYAPTGRPTEYIGLTAPRRRYKL